jgi:DNA polymerase I-like protein with 3'-5' exonuclease and polymerase domains
MPQWSAQDLREYEAYCNKHDRWIYQAAKFDLHMESAIGVIHPSDVWDRIDDTIIAGHILASNHPHDLTSMAKEYLGVDIKPFEDALEVAVKECRDKVSQAKL